MPKIKQNVYHVNLYPTAYDNHVLTGLFYTLQHAFCYTLDGLKSGRYKIDSKTVYDVIDKQIMPDWISERPQDAEIGYYRLVRYVVRDACNKWFDHGKAEADVEALKAAHKDHMKLPYCWPKGRYDKIAIFRLAKIKIDPVTLPTDIHSYIIHRDGAKWTCDILAEKSFYEVDSMCF